MTCTALGGGAGYCSPNIRLVEFYKYLSEMETMIRIIKKSHPTIMIAGDFNSNAIAWGWGWGGYRTDRSGTSLMDMLTKKGIVPINMRGGHTFCRNGRRSFIDVISTDKGLTSKYAGGRIPKVWTTSTIAMFCTILGRRRGHGISIILDTRRKKRIWRNLF